MNDRAKFSATAAVLAIALGVAATGFAGSADVDCTMCHDSAPVPDAHMPVDEVTTESCGMCHEASGDDAYFRVIHEKHGEALGCDSCHADASADHAAKLEKMLGK